LEPKCEISLEVFQGPLDLLLHLIHRNKLDIRDIPIALVTSQYLAYLELLRSLDVVVAAEYLVMAATLMQIKSRMLLPRPSPVDDEDDPRLEIVRPLEELKRLKELAQELGQRPVLGRDVFIRPGGACPEMAEGGEEAGLEADIMELIKAFERILGNQDIPRAIEIARSRTTLAERSAQIAELIRKRGRLSFWDLLPERAEKDYVIVTFLALLELAKQRLLRVVQEPASHEILLIATGS